MTPIAPRLRADLVAALKAGDATRSSALRVALAALANAEAVDPAGPTTGAGLLGDVARRQRTDADVVAVLAAERDDLRDQAAALRARGRAEADDLDDRAAVLAAYLPTDERAQRANRQHGLSDGGAGGAGSAHRCQVVPDGPMSSTDERVPLGTSHGHE